MRILALLFCSLFLIFAKCAPDQSGATVQELSGVKIFILSKPVSENIYLGKAKVTGLVSSSKPAHMMDCLIRQVKKDYPAAQGLIVTDLSFETGDAIIFK